MEDKFNSILELLNKNSVKYPNITTLWKEFIISQYKQLNDTLNQCKNIFILLTDVILCEL